jgi:hypothetical protein
MTNETLLSIAVATSITLSVLSLLSRKANASESPERYGKNHRISPYFTVGDFLVSKLFRRIKDYALTLAELRNLEKLANRLEPLVKKYGTPTILSGGRPDSVGDWYSALSAEGYKPAKNSQHRYFAAVDLAFDSTETNRQVFKDAGQGGQFLQVILYLRQGGSSFLHLSVPNPEMPGVKHLQTIKRLD